MKITTDKVYYNGKEFIINNWPKTPVITYDDVESDIDADNDYQLALTRAIEEGYVVKDVDNKILLSWINDRGVDPISESDSRRILREGFLTLPEPREFECTIENHNVVGHDSKQEMEADWEERIATLLPKEEIKPASEEQKRDFIQDALNAYYHQAVEILSTQTLGDIERKNYEYQRDTAKLLMTTSEPPEEQEELWKEVSQWFGIETYSVSSIRELQKHFTIHRKRD